MSHCIRCDFSDDEVKEPLCSSAHSDSVTAETGREDFREVYPGDRTPGSGVADYVEVDHYYHCDGGGGDGVDVCGRVGVENSADDEHHCHHPCGTKKEGLSTAELVDTDYEEDCSGYDFHSSVDPSGEEGGVGFGDADCLEDLRCLRVMLVLRYEGERSWSKRAVM